MSLKIKIVKEEELKIPPVDETINVEGGHSCLAKPEFITCTEIDCDECIFLVNNYKAFKKSE